jgi:hypothetical protein
MQFVTIKKAADLSELVGQVYSIKGANGAQVRKQAEAALRQANPHIADLKAIPDGAVVLVPSVPGAEISPSSGPTLPGGDVFAELSGSLQVAQERLTAANKQEADDAKTTVTLAKSDEFRRLIATEEAKATVAEAVKNAEASAKQRFGAPSAPSAPSVPSATSAPSKAQKAAKRSAVRKIRE